MTPTLIHHTTIVTADDANTVYEDAAIVIESDRIAAIGSTTDVMPQYPAAERIDGRNHAVMPGFANEEEEGERQRDGNSVAGVEKILSQDPLEPPTRVTERSPKPLFHFASKEERDDLLAGFLAFQSQYQIASEALRQGNLKAAGWFPEGCYPPALPFLGPPPPKRLPWPPTRRITKLDSGDVERGQIPVVEIPLVVEPRARGQPP